MAFYDREYRDDGSGWRRSLERGQKRAEDTWTTQAIQDVVKGLTNRKSAMEDLDYALETRGYYANCVTVPRPATRDRYDFSYAEPLHVTYCRAYRWPDLYTYYYDFSSRYYGDQQLRSVANCAYPYDGDAKEFCINPYHYERNTARAGRYNDGYEGGDYMGGFGDFQRPAGGRYRNYSRGGRYCHGGPMPYMPPF